MWRGFISGNKQLRRFRVPCQPDLRSKHRQLFKRDIGVFKLKAQALVPSVVLEVGVTVSFPPFPQFNVIVFLLWRNRVNRYPIPTATAKMSCNYNKSMSMDLSLLLQPQEYAPQNKHINSRFFFVQGLLRWYCKNRLIADNAEVNIELSRL